MIALLALLVPGAAPPPEDLRPLLRALYNEYRLCGLPLPARGGRVTHSVAALSGDDQQPARVIWDRKGRRVGGRPRYRRVFAAVQYYHLGDVEHAQRVLWAEREEGQPLPDRDRVLSGAIAYWAEQANREGRCLHTIESRLRVIRLHGRRYAEQIDPLLEAVRATRVPRRSPAGTAEALIDALVDERGGGLKGMESAYARLQRAGFDAVPALIDALQDRRLPLRRTRTREWLLRRGLHTEPFIEVGHVAAELLRQIAGNDVSVPRPGAMRRSVAARQSVERWWADARLIGEEAYLVRRVTSGDGDEIKAPLRVLAAKYPHRLPRLLRSVGDGSARRVHVLETVREPTVPFRVKREMALWAATKGSYAERSFGLYVLHDIDPAAYLRALAGQLDALPHDLPSDDGTDHARYLARYLRPVVDEGAWSAYEKAIRRVGPRLRAELLYPLYPQDVKARGRFLRLLAALLSDDSPLTEEMTQRVAAGADYRLKVCDLAAARLGAALDLAAPCEPGTMMQDWAVYGMKVRAAWERHRKTLKD